MGQQQIRVSFSLGKKLLIGVVGLLFVSVAFLDVSTIILLTKDKRAYTFQMQSAEAMLAGREFVGHVTGALDALRQSLASFDPAKPVTLQQKAVFESVLKNQSAVMAVEVNSVDPRTAAMSPVLKSSRPDLVERGGSAEEDLGITPELMKLALGEIMKNSFAFVNVSRIGRPPVFAVLLADMKSASASAGIPVAAGFVPLQGFASDIKASKLVIAVRDGWVLYNSDTADFYNKKNIADDPLFDAALSSQTSAGAREYEIESGRFLGSFIKPGFDLVVLTQTAWRVAMRSTYAMTEKFILLGLMAIGAAIIFAVLFSQSISSPIVRMFKATREVAAGNFNIKLSIRRHDEIGALAGSFMAMSHKIEDLIKESMRKVHLENEIAIASTVQQTLIPPPGYTDDNIHIHSLYKSANECGGDWWGFFKVGSKLCVMIADATGHGLPSALITASARSCVSVMHKMAEQDPAFSFSPGAMLGYANRVVYDTANGKIMMTFFNGVLDFKAGTLTYANAGHNPPWLFKRASDKFNLTSLKSTGMRLGEVHEVPDYKELSVKIAPEDMLFLYTDGLLEGTNAVGEQFGKKRAIRLVESKLAEGPEAVIDTALGDFMKHNGLKELDDDLTLAVAKILKTGGDAGNA
ncbi:MAG: hypothetical protein A2583_13765 [Bdellovibrionales bacterium RIFOXYD1_FULL_53_11]|nr:MAG: hypothetical protein A2583_13765 [Bdellovibrionales bacterium RIFOXYD1_FULL_53_11]